MPCRVCSIGFSRVSRVSVGMLPILNLDASTFAGSKAPAMIESHSATHSSQMKMKPGPAISFFTSCCDFRQNEQCSGSLPA